MVVRKKTKWWFGILFYHLPSSVLSTSQKQRQPYACYQQNKRTINVRQEIWILFHIIIQGISN